MAQARDPRGTRGCRSLRSHESSSRSSADRTRTPRLRRRSWRSFRTLAPGRIRGSSLRSRQPAARGSDPRGPPWARQPWFPGLHPSGSQTMWPRWTTSDPRPRSHRQLPPPSGRRRHRWPAELPPIRASCAAARVGWASRDSGGTVQPRRPSRRYGRRRAPTQTARSSRGPARRRSASGRDTGRTRWPRRISPVGPKERESTGCGAAAPRWRSPRPWPGPPT